MSRPTESLSCLFDRINVHPKIQIKFADTKNQLADMLTKGSFTRDEWDHFLRLFNIMNFPMFLAAILFGTQCKVSCRRELKKGGPKKNHLAVEKARPACLVSRNLLSAKQTTSIDSGASYGPGKQELGQTYVSGSTGNLARDRSQNPTTRILLKSAKKMRIRFCARGNLRDTSRTNLEGQGRTTTIFKSK